MLKAQVLTIKCWDVGPETRRLVILGSGDKVVFSEECGLDECDQALQNALKMLAEHGSDPEKVYIPLWGSFKNQVLEIFPETSISIDYDENA